ncbi:MAG TPA: hypothetical protein VJW76_13335 [Verrucomicrobiae bacterium]|nr:hypothetical protein [Verrucomicrobiae bacterium]
MKARPSFSLTDLFSIATASALCVSSVMAQTPPGPPEDNGLTPKTDTIFINLPSIHNNTSTESLGVAIGQNGNVLVGWEDDGDGITDTEAIWTMFNASGVSITPDTLQTSLDPQYAGQSVSNKFLCYFRSDGSAIPGNTSWGPKIKANLFGDGFGMGATSFSLGIEVTELANINLDAGGGGDFPSVQLLTGAGGPAGIAVGVTDADAEPAGDIRIGDWEHLSNGNIVIIGESRQGDDLVSRFGGTSPGNHATLRIVTPTGQQIKAYGLVSESPTANGIWHGVGVTSNGFAVRFDSGGAKVRMFDNSGNPTSTNIDLATLTGIPGAAGGGRGDGTGFHGNGRDAYVAVTSGVDDQARRQVFVTVLNANGTLRYSKAVTTNEVLLTNSDRVDAAITPDGRVLVVFDDDDSASPSARIVLGRILDPAGNPLGGTFYVSELETPDTTTLEARRPRVSWRGELAAIVWESRNSPETQDPVVAMRLFSTFKPGSVESVGLTRVVPDTPVILPAADALGNWEPYISVLGNSTFLIEANTFAENSTSEQRYVVALQPAAGGTMRLGEGFYSDNGQPYRAQLNLSRQNGNPGRVAGDKRPGAVNFVVGGEASLYGFPASFNSDGRFNPASAFYSALAGVSTGARDGCVQTFSLDPVTLAQTMLSKAFDSAFGRCCTNTTPIDPVSDQISRFGGDLAGLDDGNFVSVVEDRSRISNPAGNATVATIFRPDGSIVKEAFKVADGDIWSNVAAYRGGFAVRVAGVIYFFDNAGTLQGQVNQSTSGDSFDGGRGDGTRLFAHINSPYLYLVGKVTTATTIKVAVWDTRNRQFVTLASVSEAGFPGGTDRANGAVDALNRLTVSWVSQPPGYVNQQVAARVLAFNETTRTIAPLTPSFFPFINASTNDTIRSLQMSVAMTTRQICVAAKGEINLLNNPAAGATSPREVNFYTLFSHPDPQNDPTPAAGGGPTLTVARSASTVTLSWPAAVTGFTLEETSTLTSPSWGPVSGVVNNSVNVTASSGNKFYRLRQ